MAFSIFATSNSIHACGTGTSAGQLSALKHDSAACDSGQSSEMLHALQPGGVHIAVGVLLERQPERVDRIGGWPPARERSAQTPRQTAHQYLSAVASADLLSLKRRSWPRHQNHDAGCYHRPHWRRLAPSIEIVAMKKWLTILLFAAVVLLGLAGWGRYRAVTRTSLGLALAGGAVSHDTLVANLSSSDHDLVMTSLAVRGRRDPAGQQAARGLLNSSDDYIWLTPHFILVR